jgi:hypothetical protein
LVFGFKFVAVIQLKRTSLSFKSGVIKGEQLQKLRVLFPPK